MINDKLLFLSIGLITFLLSFVHIPETNREKRIAIINTRMPHQWIHYPSRQIIIRKCLVYWKGFQVLGKSYGIQTRAILTIQ